MTYIPGGGGGGGPVTSADITDATTAGRTILTAANAGAQRTALGLGTAATSATGDFAAASHTHDAGDVVSGTVATARLGSGTANAGTFLRGDQTWAAPTASVAINTATVSTADGDSARRVTVTDGTVTATSKIIVTVKRPDTTDATDRGIVYIPNVVRVGTGDFDVALVALDQSGMDPTGLIPNETLTLYYQVAA